MWPHLRCTTSQLMPLADCEVGLLIGYNCSRALVPRDVIPHKTMDHMRRRPIESIRRQRSPLQGCEARCGIRHLVLHSERTTTKETIDPIQIVRMVELDFSERYPEEMTLSRNDLKFISRVKQGINQRTDQYYERKKTRTSRKT